MKVEVTIPSVGESITSGVLSIWHKKDGEQVAADELLFTLETDKVSQEVNAPAAGVVSTKVAEGTEVKIGQLVAEIDPAATGAAPVAPATPAPTPTAAPVAAPTPAPVVAAPKSSPAPTPTPVLATPAPTSSDSRAVRKKMTPLRRKIAAQLVKAQHTAAILTTFNECDMSAVMSLRKALQEDFSKKHGVKLGFMSFFVKAVIDALQAVPAINSRIDGDDLILNNSYDVGVAVGTEKGLVVPVVRDCEKLSFADIETRLAAYAAKAREGKISLDDLSGGVFTISNGGVYGSLLSTPILNPPQSGILGMHKIQERPVVVNGQIVARPMMYLALSYDHRVVDGKDAVTFLIRVKDCIENPARLLLGA
ncbi:MAG: dihydrolipoyllysine-residue succinyltransferase [Verrucomicrobia bacterium]|nr:dihydrolipoyllysine-residue succinyltransferase [Verrucomicrobiota bacterium]